MWIAEKAFVLAGVMAVAAAGAAQARADQITIRRMPPYPNVTIADVKDGAISFRLPSGATNTKPLRDVELIRISANEAFNRAEQLAADANMAAAAVAAYDAAAGAMSAGWQARLLRYRRLEAAEAAGLIDRAAADWLAAMDEGPSKAVQDLRPRVPGKITGGAAAIRLLEDKLTSVKDAAYLSAVKGLLLRLYEQEGLKDKAAALAAELTGGGATSAPASVSDRDQLRGVQVLVERGQAAEALAEIENRLEHYGEADLPRALLLMGKAKKKLAEAASDAAAKKKQLLEGALALMRVYAHYPRSADAAEALFLAGEAHTLLPSPNNGAAAAAFERVVKEYPSSPFAASAKTALEKIKR